jgi:signal transduction histidine kinase
VNPHVENSEDELSFWAKEDVLFSAEDVETVIQWLCSGARYENSIHLNYWTFDAHGASKQVSLSKPDPFLDPFCQRADKLPGASVICAQWHKEVALACYSAGPLFTTRVVNCPFGLSLIVAPVEHRTAVKAVLFAGNWRDLGALGLMHHRLDDAAISQEEKDVLYKCLSAAGDQAKVFLTHDEATTLKRKVQDVVQEVSRLIRLIYVRDQVLKEHTLIRLVLHHISNFTAKTLAEACSRTEPLLSSLRKQLSVEYIALFSNAGSHLRLDLSASSGLPSGFADGVYIDGVPSAVSSQVRGFYGLSRPDQKKWCREHFSRTAWRRIHECLYDTEELVPIELGHSFVGILAFGPRMARKSSGEADMTLEEHHRLVLVARKYLANGLGDIAQRQEVADLLKKFSHILRGPLMTMQGAIDSLKVEIKQDIISRETLDTTLADVQNQVADLTQQAELIEQAAATGLTEGAKPDFRIASLALLISKAWEGMAQMAAARGITIDGFQGLRRLPDVEFDWNNMRVVFVNLLHNAVKYAHNNEIIKLSGEAITLKGVSAVRVCVADFGTGIHPDEIKTQIFLPGFRGTVRDLKRDIVGVGMGLAVCREIVEQVHHGRIWARCTEKDGAPGTYQHCWVEFFVELPLRQPAQKG